MQTRIAWVKTRGGAGKMFWVCLKFSTLSYTSNQLFDFNKSIEHEWKRRTCYYLVHRDCENRLTRWHDVTLHLCIKMITSHCYVVRTETMSVDMRTNFHSGIIIHQLHFYRFIETICLNIRTYAYVYGKRWKPNDFIGKMLILRTVFCRRAAHRILSVSR
jgi:hypothetical protein